VVWTSSRNQITSKGIVLLLVTVFAGGSVLVGWAFYAPAVFIVDDGILVELILGIVIFAVSLVLAEFYAHLTTTTIPVDCIRAGFVAGAAFGMFVLPI
jgi:hypothetical protein